MKSTRNTKITQVKKQAYANLEKTRSKLILIQNMMMDDLEEGATTTDEIENTRHAIRKIDEALEAKDL